MLYLGGDVEDRSAEKEGERDKDTVGFTITIIIIILIIIISFFAIKFEYSPFCFQFS